MGAENQTEYFITLGVLVVVFALVATVFNHSQLRVIEAGADDADDELIADELETKTSSSERMAAATHDAKRAAGDRYSDRASSDKASDSYGESDSTATGASKAAGSSSSSKAAAKSSKPRDKVKTPYRRITSSIKREVASLTTMDSLLDYADSQQRDGEIEIALYAYTEALRKYRTNSYAPFIAIDIANIQKEEGQYLPALITYQQAALLPAVRRDKKTQADFENIMDYLEVLIDLIEEEGLPPTPFSKLPPSFKKRVDERLKEKKGE